MRYDLLARLADLDWPVTIEDPDEVDRLRSYLAARLVTAMIPDVVRTGARTVQAPAKVLTVTAEGIRTLRRHRHRAMWAGNQPPGHLL